MGNSSSSAQVAGRRRRGNRPPPAAPAPPPAAQPQVGGNHYVFAAATPYPGQYPNPNPPQYYPYGGYYPSALPAPFDHHHHRPGAGVDPAAHPNWGGPARYGCPPPHPPPAAYVEHQKAVTIKNDVNLKKETLRIEPDEDNPGHHLVTFTFDATVAGSITVLFFAKEGDGCKLLSAKEKFEPVTLTFEKGLGQKFRQPTGTGINFSLFEEFELTKIGGDPEEVYPLAVKAETCAEAQIDGNNVSTNSLITQAVFEIKDQGEYHVKVLKQILWVENMRYELQEIYGIGNSVENDLDGNDPGKECVICLSEARDTTVLPCRHMCLCSGCADVLRFQTSKCPICRQPVERFLEIKLSNAPETKTCEGSKDNSKEVLDAGEMKPAKQVSE